MPLLTRKEVTMLRKRQAIQAVQSIVKRTGCKLASAYHTVQRYAKKHKLPLVGVQEED